MKKRLQPPKEQKADLMIEVEELLARKFRMPFLDTHSAILYLLNYFTSWDLVEIRDELLRKEKRNDVRP